MAAVSVVSWFLSGAKNSAAHGIKTYRRTALDFHTGEFDQEPTGNSSESMDSVGRASDSSATERPKLDSVCHG
jgi:hypothetical protein